MALVELKAQPRTVIGKQVKQLRREGWTPGVIYGISEPETMQVSTHELAAILRNNGRDVLIALDLNGTDRRVVVQDLQRHLTRGDLLHIDLYEVVEGQMINSDANLVLVNKSALAATGAGYDQLLLQSVHIESTPMDNVNEIEVDASKITETHNVLTIADIVAPPGVTILNNPHDAVAKFQAQMSEKEAESDSELTPTEVEIITEADDDE
jgi:large subunit ribosomal protein L25